MLQLRILAYIQLLQRIITAIQILQCRKALNPLQVTDILPAAIYPFYRRNFIRTERLVIILVNFYFGSVYIKGISR